ncbi:MAG: sulfite exporter TauE/SafE family protein [Acidobacteriota bacterium]|nr:sulfite exporter TauE/SafE family protein [Acidobacteriota bacterium]
MTFFILLAAAFLGGISNALAGGGTFLVFPALLLGGIAPVQANATASLVLLPGAFASVWVYRDTVIGSKRSFLMVMSAASLVGSLLGSILLLSTSNATFASLVPWLLLIATGVFTIAPWLRKIAASKHGHQSLVGLIVGQAVISVYGGYFGAGMGVLMIALYLVVTSLEVHAASGLRMLCSVVINILAVIIFAWRGALVYSAGIPMLIAGIAGGYAGALWVKRLNANHARIAILAYAWALTAWFFLKPLLFARK